MPDKETLGDVFTRLIRDGDIDGVANEIRNYMGVHIERLNNSQEESIISVAIKEGKYDIVEMLVEGKYKGERLDVNCDIASADKVGKTVLMEACDYGNDSMLRQISGRRENRDKITELLMTKSTERDIMQVDASGMSPLMYACRSGNVVAVEKMLDKLEQLGKSQEDIMNYLNQRDKHGYTAGMYAQLEDRTDIEELLQSRGYQDALKQDLEHEGAKMSREASIDSGEPVKKKLSLMSRLKKVISKGSGSKENRDIHGGIVKTYDNSVEYLNLSYRDLVDDNDYRRDSAQSDKTFLSEERDESIMSHRSSTGSISNDRDVRESRKSSIESKFTMSNDLEDSENIIKDSEFISSDEYVKELRRSSTESSKTLLNERQDQQKEQDDIAREKARIHRREHNTNKNGITIK